MFPCFVSRFCPFVSPSVCCFYCVLRRGRGGSKKSQKTHCHQCLVDDYLFQHSTRKKAERADSSNNKQRKGALLKQCHFSTSFSQILQKRSLNALLACCSSPITTLSSLVQPFHEPTAETSYRSVLTEEPRPTKKDMLEPPYISSLRADCTQDVQRAQHEVLRSVLLTSRPLYLRKGRAQSPPPVERRLLLCEHVVLGIFHLLARRARFHDIPKI